MTTGNSPAARCLARRQQGQATLEFVLMIFPFLVVALLAIDFGVFGWDLVSVTNAAREAGRYASVNCVPNIHPDTTPGCQPIDVQRIAVERSDGMLTNTDVAVWWCDRTPSNGLIMPARGDSVVVTVTKTHDLYFVPNPAALPIYVKVDAPVEKLDAGSTLVPGGVGNC
jgi:Flp pilus assembly protein TadG